MTKSPDRRVESHNKGYVRSTRPYRPFCLIYMEEIKGTRKEAREREKYWKSGIGKEKLRVLKDKT